MSRFSISVHHNLDALQKSQVYYKEAREDDFSRAYSWRKACSYASWALTFLLYNGVAMSWGKKKNLIVS